MKSLKLEIVICLLLVTGLRHCEVIALQIRDAP
jgi:integrase